MQLCRHEVPPVCICDMCAAFYILLLQDADDAAGLHNILQRSSGMEVKCGGGSSSRWALAAVPLVSECVLLACC